MSLFLLGGMPLFALLAGVTAVSGAAPSLDRGETARGLGWLYGAGLLSGLPCLALLLLLRDAIGSSYRSGRLYFSVALVEHLLPVALALACFVLVHLARIFGREREGLASSFGLAVFLGGYFSIFAVAEYVGQRGELTGHALFLLPLVRLTQIVVCARALPLVVETAGGRRILPAAAMAAWAFLAAFEGLWSRQGRYAAALILSVGLSLCIVAGGFALISGRASARAARTRVG